MALLRFLAIGCLVAGTTTILSGCSGTKAADEDSGSGVKAVNNKTPSAGKNKGGEVKNQATKGEPIAHDRFPRPEGVEIVTTIADTRTVMLRGAKKLEECLKFYESELGKLNWTKNEAESETIDGVGFLAYTKGGLKLGITFNPSRDGKSMTIMAQGSGMAVPAKHNEGE